MSRDFDLELKAAHPSLMRDLGGDPRKTCMSQGCTISSGWHQIMRDLCKELDSLGDTELHFSQVKEKFGEMRVYLNNGTARARKIVHKYEAMSNDTCECCGRPGFICSKGNWLKALCADCMKLPDYGSYRILEATEDDDG